MKKRAFLKVVACFMAVCMSVLMFGGFTFSDRNVSSDEPIAGCCGESEIIFDDIDCEETMQLIIATLNGEILITPNSILCIFGHSISTGTARVIDHRVWTAAPRCRETTYRVQHCTRSGCNHMVLTQLTQFRIHCCA